jgi:hypothetical protein
MTLALAAGVTSQLSDVADLRDHSVDSEFPKAA